MENREKIIRLMDLQNEISTFYRAIGKMSFDVECVCPKNGIEQANKDMTFLSRYPFRIAHSDEYINLIKDLHKNSDGLNEYEKELVRQLYRKYEENKNVSEELNTKYNELSNNAYLSWLNAKEKNDYSLFKSDFKAMIDISKELYKTRDNQKDTLYETMLCDYEDGLTIKKLDSFFDLIKKELVPLIKKINHSKVKIREDFLSRKVSIPEQEKFSRTLLKLEGHSFDNLVLMTTEHPFTTGFGRGDERVTTHFYEDNFVSNIFTTLHEGGHALFDLNEPDEFYKYHINGNMTMAMHECMSRLFENLVGRSEAFVGLIYPLLNKEFNGLFNDVSKEEFYKGINVAKPSLIRCDADELTYPLHILIRYELEKEFINGNVDMDDLKEKWNDYYEKYSGIRPQNDSEGILQDIHRSSTYGYFPSYALGSAYGAQIIHRMNEDFNVDQAIRENRIIDIVNWLKNHAWNIASISEPSEWLKKVTGEDFNPYYYINYLKEKYKKIYNL